MSGFKVEATPNLVELANAVRTAFERTPDNIALVVIAIHADDGDAIVHATPHVDVARVPELFRKLAEEIAENPGQFRDLAVKLAAAGVDLPKVH